MKLEIISENDKISEKKLKNLEKKYNINFPQEYIDFMLEYNGGETSNLVFIIDYLKISFLKIYEFFNFEELSKFLKDIKKDSEANPEENYWLPYLKYNKKQMIPIAETYQDHLICISVSKENFGKIYFVDHVHDDEFIFLTNNFNDFINSFSSPYANEFEEACETGNFKKARELIHNGFDINSLTYYGESVYSLALYNKLYDIFLFIAKDIETPLISSLSSIDMLNILIDNGYNINELDKFGKTSLFYTSRFDIVKNLIEKGIDVTIKDNLGKKAIDYINPDESEEKRKIYNLLKEVEERHSFKQK